MKFQRLIYSQIEVTRVPERLKFFMAFSRVILWW